jgi:hypothetical protein
MLDPRDQVAPGAAEQVQTQAEEVEQMRTMEQERLDANACGTFPNNSPPPEV